MNGPTRRRPAGILMPEAKNAQCPSPHAELLKRVGTLAAEHGTRAFLVGGPVRDMLLGRSSPDLDVAVESRCREIGAALARALDGRFVYHARFITGTVTLGAAEAGLPDHLDIAQTRTETYARPGVLPTVKPAGIAADLRRRDFSVNAIACEIAPRAFGRFIDPCAGRSDIGARLVRVLHDRSFVDDPTRAFRAVRFAVRLGFEIEPHTLKLMRDCIRAGYPRLLTPERILCEIKLICAEPMAVRMFEAVLKENLLASCFGPGSLPTEGSAALLGDLHRLSQQKATPELLYILVLSHLPLTPRFPVTRLERDAVRALASFGRIRGRLAKTRRPSAVYRLLKTVPVPALEALRRLETGAAADNIGRHLDDYSRTRTHLTGYELRQLGLRPGPGFHRVLEQLLAARLDRRARTAEDELRLARRMVRRVKVN